MSAIKYEGITPSGRPCTLEIAHGYTPADCDFIIELVKLFRSIPPEPPKTTGDSPEPLKNELMLRATRDGERLSVYIPEPMTTKFDAGAVVLSDDSVVIDVVESPEKPAFLRKIMD